MACATGSDREAKRAPSIVQADRLARTLSETIFGCTPSVSKRVAQVCLGSWHLISGSPALLRGGFECRTQVVPVCGGTPGVGEHEAALQSACGPPTPPRGLRGCC